VRAGHVATACRMRLEDAGIAVEVVARATWVARVAGGAHVEGETKGGRLARAVAAGFVNWPADTGPDMRDAGGLAVYAVLPPPEVKAAPVPRAPRDATPVRYVDKRKGRPERKAKRAAIRAAKDAAGCRCLRQHARACPLYVPKEERAAKGFV